MDNPTSVSKYAQLLVIFLLSVLLWQCQNSHDPLEPLKSATHYLNLHDSVEYVGMQACKECHYPIYQSYLRTGMGQSFDSASKRKSAAIIGVDSVLYDSYKDLYIKPFWQGDSMMVSEYRLNHDQSFQNRNEFVNYIVGSGQHTNSHIYLSGKYAYQVPFTYYTQLGLFDMPPGFEFGKNSRFSRKIGLECMSCHNGFPEMVLGSMNKYEYIPDGIDCERCHGPGEIHVKLKKSGFIVDTSRFIDYSIVNPAKIPTDLKTDVCARCHLQGTMVLQPGKSFYDFKPGMNLDSVMDIFMPLFEGGKEDFIMASHYERMIQSTCYRESGGQFTCTDCHNPHISVKETPQLRYNKVCMECHHEAGHRCSLAGNDDHPDADNCVQCHIREGETRDIPHVSTHDHKISIPPTEEELLSKRIFKGLVSVNNPNTDALQKAKGYLLEYESYHPDPSYLDSAWKYMNVSGANTKVASFNARINYYFLKNDFKEISRMVETDGIRKVLDIYLVNKEFSNYDAWTAYRIGQAYQNSGNALMAEYFYRKAVKLAPYVLDFQMKYGSILATGGEIGAAMDVFRFIISEDPRFASAYVNLGYLLVKQNKLEQGEELYLKALKIQPDHVQALLNLAALNLIIGEKQLANSYLERVLEIDPGNINARQLERNIHHVK